MKIFFFEELEKPFWRKQKIVIREILLGFFQSPMKTAFCYFSTSKISWTNQFDMVAIERVDYAAMQQFFLKKLECVL